VCKKLHYLYRPTPEKSNCLSVTPGGVHDYTNDVDHFYHRDFLQHSRLFVVPPQLFWPQKDIDSFSVNQPTLAKKVLIVSRGNDFKRALVDEIKDAFKGDSVYVKCTGLTKLKNEDASAYGAIVIINTCMGWDWDRNIHAFLKGKQDAKNVIVLTTSASGK
jgi:hypothetical protein